MVPVLDDGMNVLGVRKDRPRNTPAPEPEVTTPEPEVTTPEPEVTTPEPEVTTPEPEVTTPEPEVTTSEPEATAPEPEATAPEPEVTAPEPEVTTSEPEAETPAFNPRPHNMDDVKTYVTENPDQVDAILDAEKAGLARTTLVAWLEDQKKDDSGLL